MAGLPHSLIFSQVSPKRAAPLSHQRKPVMKGGTQGKKQTRERGRNEKVAECVCVEGNGCYKGNNFVVIPAVMQKNTNREIEKNDGRHTA